MSRKKIKDKESQSLTADLSFDEITLVAFNAIGPGELKVKILEGKIISLTFTRKGMEHNFCVHGICAKKLAAYIALWA